MKSSDARGPSSNRSSQRFPCGVMIRLEPTLTISTWCTSSGNATALGSRTAWLRLLVKTVDRVICTARYVYPNGIYIADGGGFAMPFREPAIRAQHLY